MSKVLMVRSDSSLVNKGQIGYGWGKVNFSKFETDKALIEELKKQYGGVGRKEKQVKLFFNLKSGDFVVVPLPNMIAIAKVVGVKSYYPKSDTGSWVKHGDNRIEVEYVYGKDGRTKFYKKALSTALQTRLKIRTTIADLKRFSKEIEQLVDNIKNGQELNSISNAVAEKIIFEEDKFKRELLLRLRNNSKISIQAGGHGLEKLVQKLYSIDGYEAKILAKSQSAGIDDIDIRAVRKKPKPDEKDVLLIQVKHHKGFTGMQGIKQLAASKEEGEKILITTAEVQTEVSDEASKYEIEIIDGGQLVEMIFDRVKDLDEKTLNKLGIAMVPVLCD